MTKPAIAIPDYEDEANRVSREEVHPASDLSRAWFVTGYLEGAKRGYTDGHGALADLVLLAQDQSEGALCALVNLENFAKSMGGLHHPYYIIARAQLMDALGLSPFEKEIAKIGG